MANLDTCILTQSFLQGFFKMHFTKLTGLFVELLQFEVDFWRPENNKSYIELSPKSIHMYARGSGERDLPYCNIAAETMFLAERCFLNTIGSIAYMLSNKSSAVHLIQCN